MNKFEQVSSDGHQMSLVGGAGLGSGGSPELKLWEGAGAREACTVRTNASWVMVDRQTHTCETLLSHNCIDKQQE